MEETLIKTNATDYSSVLRRALDLGEMVLMSGGEVGRVEDTVSRICYAYGAERVDVLTITSSIIVTVITPRGEAITQTRRITSKGYDLTRLDALNRLSRHVCETLPSADYIDEKLCEIKGRRAMRWYLMLFAEIVIAFFFTVFFGGSWMDAAASGFVALSIFLMERIRGNIHINKIVFLLSSSFIAGAVSVATVHLGIGHNVNAIMIGAIMLLIPGISITAAFEDLLTGDTITGLLQICESVIMTVGIAVGFAVATFICGGYDMLNDGIGDVNPWMQVFVSVFASGGFALLFGVKKPQRLIAAALVGGLTQLAYAVVMIPSANNELSLLIAAAVGAAIAQVMARVMRVPATFFTIPSIIPLVPGSSLYYTMSWALRGNFAKFSERGMATLLSALSIAFGMMIVLVLTGGITAVIRKIKIRKHLR